ncbi:MAG: AMP-binding protein [Flammeovirgaceae bacterium]|jgi:malonyl-CoA/methylmalonyl-CoA synthetase|nr:AMP-binding protein [Flammeovirgaceae bacterium]|tara:strand:- start:75145 stop:76626 length:1482 start_codon:yes stop_codon:yes gene_type:complete
MIQLIERASYYTNQLAIIAEGQTFTYQQLLERSRSIARYLLDGKADLDGARIVFMVTPGFDYVAIQWGIWLAGGVAVPLNPGSPIVVSAYVIADTAAEMVIASVPYQDLFHDYCGSQGIALKEPVALDSPMGELPTVEVYRNAMILYTSGTTGKPKGVVTTHINIQSQITSLVQAWDWSANDHILNVLPLHHVHGIINVLGCALWSGATCEFLNKFDSKNVFEILSKESMTLFMAVPTIYHQLIQYWESLADIDRKRISMALSKLRLMVSGSAALPVSVLEKWKALSGQTLLERYGMTEIGMAISNPYVGTRRPGYIGAALPGVKVRIVDEQFKDLIDEAQGEILVKGPGVFKEYWGLPEATKDSFTLDGWFKTGDIAFSKNGDYKIVGRSSVDIIKSGGYKISALEIEEVLRSYGEIADCAVLGLPNEEWGELIVAVIVPKRDASLKEKKLDEWMRTQLPKYKIPRTYLFLKELPRNAMGKVVKKELAKSIL